MRNIFLILLLTVVATSSYAHVADLSTAPPKKKKPQKKEKKKQFGLVLPGWLVSIGINAVIASELDEEEQAMVQKMRPLWRRLSSVRLLVAEDGAQKAQRFRERYFGKKSRQGLEMLVKVRDGSTYVNLFAQLKKKKKKTIVKKVVLLIEDEGELTYIVLNGRWDNKVIQQVVRDLK